MTEDPLDSPPLQQRAVSLFALFCVAGLAMAPLYALFGDAPQSARQSVIQVALIFGLLLCVFRVIGKRELGRMSPFEFVTLMLVPEIVSEVVQGNGQLSSSLIGLSTLFMLVLLTSILSHRFKPFQNLVEAEPTILVSNGKLITQHMNDERIAPDELLSEMRKQGLEHVSQIKWAILEGSGNITFVPLQAAALPHACKQDDGIQ